MHIDIEYCGYHYRLRHDGNQFVATCQRTGRQKVRRNYRVWCNVIGQRSQELVQDTELVEALEDGVNQFKSLLARQQPHSMDQPSARVMQGLDLVQRRLNKRNRERRDHAQN